MGNSLTPTIELKYAGLKPVLGERARRLGAAGEARSIGRGGITRVADATGLSRVTIRAGLKEIGHLHSATVGESDAGRIRRPGGGRKPLVDRDPKRLSDPEPLVDPVTRGDPMSPLRWTCKSAAKWAERLRSRGHAIRERTVNRLLYDLGYSRQANRTTIAGRQHPDRDAQFPYINRRVRASQRQGQPVVAVDTQKKDRVGPYRQGGREWQPEGEPEEVKVHDFIDKALGEAIPHGVYDMAANAGWVRVGVDHDTAEFAVESLRRWWRDMGGRAYPRAKRLLITADGGGSNGSRCRLGEGGLQRRANEVGLEVSVSHLPPGTSKWNKIEHRMSCHLPEDGRGRPLVSREVVVNLIGHTTTKAGPSIRSELDENSYPTGREVTAEQWESLSIREDRLHGNWNYTIRPKQ